MRDSHGLFDYEGKEVERKQLKGLNTCKCTILSTYLPLTNFHIFKYFYLVVSIMRNDANVEIKDSEDLSSEESKEEEIK